MTIGRRFRTALGLARMVVPYWGLGVLRLLLPLPSLVRFAWRAPSRSRDAAREQRTVAQLVKLGHIFRRSDRHCLQRSLVLYRELSRDGADPHLVVGFRPSPAGLEGHAWIELNGVAVGEPDDVRTFQRTVEFGARGQRLEPTLS
jgi:hypothetical protein